MSDFQAHILSIRGAFELDFTRTKYELEQLFKAVNSNIDCVITENNDKDDNQQEHITKFQDICFLLKRFCSEANLNVKLLTLEDRNETITKETMENKISEDIKPEPRPEQTDDLNKILSYERYSEVFTYSTIDLSKFKVGFEAKFSVTYIKESVDHSIFVMETPPTDIIIKQPDFQYHNVPDEGIIFGILLDGFIIRAVRENQLKIPAITFRVLLIDFGEILKISKEHKMYQLPEKLQKIPGQAIFCKLTKDNNCDDQNSLKDILHTKQTIRIEKILGNMLEVTVNPTKKSKMQSELFESRNFIGDNASILNGHSCEGSITSSTCSDVKNVCGLTEQNHEEPLNTEISLETDYASQVDKKISIFGKDNGFYKVKIHSEIPMPRVGKKIHLLVSYVVDVEKFYGQIIPKNCNSPENLTVEKIVNEMNDNKMQLKLKPLTMAPAEFELVLAMYTDKLWYRARILHKTSDGLYKVFYVDYGNCSTVTLDLLRKWEDEFDCYPFQAFECILDNVSKLRDNHKEAIDYFESLVLNKPVKATVTCNVHRLHVTLQDESRFDVGEQLCVSKYAQQKPITGAATVQFLC